MKLVFLKVLLVCIFLLSQRSIVSADYVLPYPSYMPGNKLYSISRLFDEMKKYWYWGSIASITYHLSQSDRYLIEAKTLFEYKQYLLGVAALKRSDKEFVMLPIFLKKASVEKKDITAITLKISEAANKHKEILQRLLKDSPESVTWSPEKSEPSMLFLSRLISDSIDTRDRVLKAIP